MKSKKFLCVIALVAFAFQVNAQTEKGNIMIGGSATYSRTKSIVGDFYPKTYTYNIGPNVGYFVKNNLAIGLGLNYGRTKTRGYSYQVANGVAQTMGDQQTTYSVSPFVRYYGKITDNLKFFGEFNVSYGQGEHKEVNIYGVTSNYDLKQRMYGAAISPGLAFFPAKKWAIEFSFPLVSYTKETAKTRSGGTAQYPINTLAFGLDSFNPAIGINFHF